MNGGAPRVVWQTTETDPRVVSARSAAQRLDQTGCPVHLVWNPLSGDVVQLLPATRAGCGLHAADGRPAGNRDGRVCIQITVVGFAREPFTDGPMTGIDAIMDWLDTWHVPRRWPAGPPAPFPEALHRPRDRRTWSQGGHYGCSQVPDAVGGSPGAIDVTKVVGVPATLIVPAPRREVAPAPDRADGPARPESAAAHTKIPS